MAEDITLVRSVQPERVTLSAQQSYVLAAGKRVQIRTLPPMHECLDAQVPSGKAWDVTITVHITESNA